MDRGEQRLLTAFRSLRNTMASAIDQIDLILDLAEQPKDDRKRGQCPHPIASRTPKASMGHPNRFHCRTCGEDVEE